MAPPLCLFFLLHLCPEFVRISEKLIADFEGVVAVPIYSTVLIPASVLVQTPYKVDVFGGKER